MSTRTFCDICGAECKRWQSASLTRFPIAVKMHSFNVAIHIANRAQNGDNIGTPDLCDDHFAEIVQRTLEARSKP